MQKKMLLLINPNAGKGQVRGKMLEIVDIFTKAGFDVTVYPTQQRLDARNTVQKRGGEFERIVCVGGDGTLNEIVNGVLMSKNRPLLGYIPAGTTDDFAKTLKLPLTPIKAAHRVAEGRPFPCDVGKFNEHYFIYSAAFGAFSDVPYITPQKSKNLLGWMAYFLQGIERLSSIKSYPMTIKHGKESVRGDFIFGMVTNSDSVGGFKGLSGMPVKLDDGEHEVVLVKMPQSLAALQNIVKALVTKDMSAPGIYAFHAREMVLESNFPVAWTLDGEFGGSHREMKVETLKQVISLLI